MANRDVLFHIIVHKIPHLLGKSYDNVQMNQLIHCSIFWFNISNPRKSAIMISKAQMFVTTKEHAGNDISRIRSIF